VAGLGIEAGGGLVEQKQLGLVHEAAGDGEPPLHAAREGIDAVVAAVGEPGEGEQLLGPGPDLGHRHAEVAAVDDEVVPDGELGVEVVVLGDDADAAPDLGAAVGGIEAQDLQVAAGASRDAGDHAHRRGLAGAVGPQEPEDLALLDGEVDAVDGPVGTELLGQAPGRHQRRGPGTPHRLGLSPRTGDVGRRRGRHAVKLPVEGRAAERGFAAVAGLAGSHA
jgi:hypothetical protein